MFTFSTFLQYTDPCCTYIMAKKCQKRLVKSSIQLDNSISIYRGRFEECETVLIVTTLSQYIYLSISPRNDSISPILPAPVVTLQVTGHYQKSCQGHTSHIPKASYAEPL